MPIKKAPNQISPLKEHSIEIQEIKSINKTEYADMSHIYTPEKNYLMKVPSPTNIIIEEKKSQNVSVEDSEIGPLYPNANSSMIDGKVKSSNLRNYNSI